MRSEVSRELGTSGLPWPLMQFLSDSCQDDHHVLSRLYVRIPQRWSGEFRREQEAKLSFELSDASVEVCSALLATINSHSCELWLIDLIQAGVSGNSRSRLFPFPAVPGNDSLWFLFPKCGNGFFHSLPVFQFWEWFFSIPFQFPNFGNGIIHSCSRSRTPKCHSCSPLI